MVYVPDRQYTNKMLEAVEEGLLDRDQVILACLKWMTDRDVHLMAKANEFLEEDKEDDDADKDEDEDDWMIATELSHD
jgi:hypothetical protein